MEITTKCSECGGLLEQGFVPDSTYGGALNPKWVTKVKGWGVFTKFENYKYVTTYRCTSCGLLKSYAR